MSNTFFFNGRLLGRCRGGLLACLLGLALGAQSQQPAYWDEIQAFRKADSLAMPAAGALLFVGSSSFHYWQDVADYFPRYRLLNRGFGGSTLLDVIRYAPDIIYPYRPAQVVIYAGENDLAYSDSTSPAMVLDRFRELFGLIRKNLGAVPVLYVSIKPSPSRVALMPRMSRANTLIRKYLKKQKAAEFVDVYHAMLTPAGLPRPEIFGGDSLHMNADGYRIWQKILEPRLLKGSPVKTAVP